MRWLFLFVLLLNVFYVIWQLSIPEEGLYSDVAALNSIEPILLVRELKQGGIVIENQDSVTNVAVLGIDEERVVSSPVAVEQDGRCFTLGPFYKKQNLQSLKKEIASYVKKSAIKSRDEKEYTVHWVYIQPEKNRKKIIALGKKLKVNKIKDFYFIREGEKNNGISLGHFRDKKRAFSLVSKVKKLGFDVRVEPLFKSFEVFWLDYQLVSEQFPKLLLEKYLLLEDSEKINSLIRECDA